MKLLIAAAALLAGVSAKPGTIRKLDQAAATPKLMSKAMKYSDFVAKHAKNMPGRKLDDAEFEIDGTYSIQPQECVNFQVESEDVYDEDIIAMAAQGDALPEASYVIFQVVSTASAYYEDGSSDSSISWIAPLGEYMEASVTYKYNMKADFCEQCQRNEEYCGYGDQQEEGDEAEEDNEAEEEQEDGGRKLAAFERKLAGNYIDCSECTAMDCWEAEEEDGQEDDGAMDDDDLVEYVTELAGCADTGLVIYSQYGEEVNLMAGFICGNNTFGGPEIGLFLDDACTIYYQPMDYYTAVKGSSSAYYNQGGRKLDDAAIVLTEDQLDTINDYIIDPYSNGIDCAAAVEYDEYNADGDQEEEDQNEEQDYEANEVCQTIMQADAVPLATCGYENGEEQEDAEEEAEDEWEGNEYNFIAEYELTEDQVDDIQAVCTFYNTYDWEMYKGDVYAGEIHYSDPDKVSSWANTGSLTAGAKFGIAVLVLAIVGGIAFFALKKKKSADDYKLEPLHESKGTSA